MQIFVYESYIKFTNIEFERVHHYCFSVSRLENFVSNKDQSYEDPIEE